MKIKLVLSILLLFMVSGCATKVQTVHRDNPLKVENITKISYQKGKKIKVFIGQPMVSNTSFEQSVIENALVKPDKDFTIKVVGCIAGEACKTFIPGDRYYEIVKTVKLKEKEFFVVNMSRRYISKIDVTFFSHDGTLLLVGLDGQPLEELYFEGLGIMPNGLAIKPSDVQFEIHSINKLRQSNYFDEKLTFMGMEADNILIRFTKSEFDEKGTLSKESMLLKVEKKDVIQLLNYNLKVYHISNNSIEFEVLKD